MSNPRVLLAVGMLVLSAGGCSRERVPALAPETSSSQAEVGSGANGPNLHNLGRPRVVVTTSDTLQYVERRNRDPWMRQTKVTEASTFTLTVENKGRQPAQNVRLIVSVPNTLPEYDWSVTVANQLFSGTSMFPYNKIRATGYPYHHAIYPPTGNACFTVIEGPAELAAGAVWEVPVDLFRGLTEGFKVHFDVAVDPWWASPRRGVTAEPPMSDPENADRASPFGGRS